MFKTIFTIILATIIGLLSNVVATWIEPKLKKSIKWTVAIFIFLVVISIAILFNEKVDNTPPIEPEVIEKSPNTQIKDKDKKKVIDSIDFSSTPIKISKTKTNSLRKENNKKLTYPYSLSSQVVNSEGKGISGIKIKCGNCSLQKEMYTDEIGFFSIKYSIENPTPIKQLELQLLNKGRLVNTFNIPIRQKNLPQIKLSNENF